MIDTILRILIVYSNLVLWVLEWVGIIVLVSFIIGPIVYAITRIPIWFYERAETRRQELAAFSHIASYEKEAIAEEWASAKKFVEKFIKKMPKKDEERYTRGDILTVIACEKYKRDLTQKKYLGQNITMKGYGNGCLVCKCEDGNVLSFSTDEVTINEKASWYKLKLTDFSTDGCCKNYYKLDELNNVSELNENGTPMKCWQLCPAWKNGRSNFFIDSRKIKLKASYVSDTIDGIERKVVRADINHICELHDTSANNPGRVLFKYDPLEYLIRIKFDGRDYLGKLSTFENKVIIDEYGLIDAIYLRLDEEHKNCLPDNLSLLEYPSDYVWGWDGDDYGW